MVLCQVLGALSSTYDVANYWWLAGLYNTQTKTVLTIPPYVPGLPFPR